MSREPRPATKIQWAFIWIAMAGLTVLIIAWHRSVLGSDGAAGSVVNGGLPRPQRHDFRPTADASEQSPEGLKAAALDQIEHAQRIGRGKDRSLWSWATCRMWWVLPQSGEAGNYPTVYDLVVVEIELEDYETDTARVRVIFRNQTDPSMAVANEAGGTERWDYVGGRWVNRTCEYSEGPSTLHLLLESRIQPADD